LANQALSNPNFVHVYSLTGKEDNMFMKRLINQNDFMEIQTLLYTPCDVDFSLFIKTPSTFSRTDKMLSEIGLIRPIVKPDWDNGGKKYSDMFNNNVWLDDNLVIDGTVRKFYSILSRVEIKLKYMNMLYNKYQYNSISSRMNDPNLNYFGGDNHVK
jgi:Holliday junction resolvase RusA-like endonuclease